MDKIMLYIIYTKMNTEVIAAWSSFEKQNKLQNKLMILTK